MTRKLQRLALAAVLYAALAGAPPVSAAVTAGNWDSREQHQVVAAHLMANANGRSFGGSQALSAVQANQAMAALASRIGVTPIRAVTKTPVSVVTFDRMLSDQLGLHDIAAHLQRVTRAAGLRPPGYFGSEVVVRFLGLRYNHPSGTDQLELFPRDPITRAEAAWSLAQVLDFGDWNVSYARQTLSTYALPPMTSDQQTALRIAVSRIGYPYVYAGESDSAESASWMYGPQAHGGFDCSGFVWRVFKLSGLVWGRQILGRTAAQMAGEIPRSARLSSSRLKPGDLLFFGSARINGTASEQSIDHAGIYLGGNWVIHSSEQGVYVLPLEGSWLGNTFAWGRRVIG